MDEDTQNDNVGGADLLRSNIDRRAVVRPTRFEVLMTLPPGLASSSDSQLMPIRQGMVQLWCESTSIPAVALMTHPVRRWNYGATENKPIAPRFEDARFVLRADRTGVISGFLHSWMRLALHYDMREGIGTLGGPLGTHTPFELSYKDSYAQDVLIYQYDETGTAIRRVTLREAYPVYIDAMPLAWGAINEYSRISCAMTYLTWHDDQLATNTYAPRQLNR